MPGKAGFLQRNEGVQFAYVDSVNDNSMNNDDTLLFFAGGISWTMETDEENMYTLAKRDWVYGKTVEEALSFYHN